MKYYLIMVLVVLSLSPSMGQNMKPSYGSLQITYNKGIGHYEFDKTYVVQNEGNLFRLRLSFGKYLKENFSLGIGSGFEAFHEPRFNYLPVVLESRYFLSTRRKTPFVSANFGYSIAGNTFTRGLQYHLGTGFKINQGRASRSFVGLAYESHQSMFNSHSTWIKSISFSFTYQLLKK